MTTELHDRLDDLVAEVPSHVHPDVGTAWRLGVRRRVRRRLVAGTAVVGALALAGLVGLAADRATDPSPAGSGGGSRPSASSYPSRIDAPLLRSGTLPARPGPIAGLLMRRDGWFAVGRQGQVWGLPGGSEQGWLPALSSDGTHLAYVRGRGERLDLFVIDLVTGARKVPPVTSAVPTARSAVPLNTSMFWSPDSTRLLVPVIRGTGQGEPEAVLVGAQGGTHPVAAPPGRRVVPIGWLTPRLIGWLRWEADPRHPDVVTTGPRGGRVLAAHPAPGRIPRGDFLNASLLPEGNRSHVVSITTSERQILISNPGRPRGDTAIVASRANDRYRAELCPASWFEGYPALPVVAAPGHTLLWTGPNSYVVQADPALQPVYCSVWAYDALRGHAYGGVGGALFGENDTWLSWHWRQVAIGIAAGVVVVGGGAWLALRRRRERRLTAWGARR